MSPGGALGVPHGLADAGEAPADSLLDGGGLGVYHHLPHARPLRVDRLSPLPSPGAFPCCQKAAGWARRDRPALLPRAQGFIGAMGWGLGAGARVRLVSEDLNIAASPPFGKRPAAAPRSPRCPDGYRRARSGWVAGTLRSQKSDRALVLVWAGIVCFKSPANHVGW